MIKHANKILYIGTGEHIEPVKHFPLTKEFIFIDSQPRSEFDSYYPQFNKLLYKSHFVNDIIDTCKCLGFLLESFTILDKNYYKKIITNKMYYTSWFYKIPPDINPSLLTFTNAKTQQHIKYYISTNIKFNMNDELKNDIKSCDGIIVSGYFPEMEILENFGIPKVLFGYSNTCFKLDEYKDNDNDILYFLHNFLCNIQYYFIEFYLIYYDSGVIIKCQDFQNLVEINQEYYNQYREQTDDNNYSINSLYFNDV